MLALKIINNKKIKGITINKEEYLMSQYADDTLVILNGTEQSLQHCIEDYNILTDTTWRKNLSSIYMYLQWEKYIYISM